jgi:hypothetical protein
MATSTPSTQAQTWKRLISEWQRSGQTAAAFCRARNLRENQFHYWRPLVAPRPTAKPGAPVAPLKPFVPITVAPPKPAPAPSAEFVLGSRLVLRVTGELSVARVAALAKALQAAGC